jgi:hypothetical protein
MHLFLLHQDQNRSPGMIEACVVVAPDDEYAQFMHPKYPDVRYDGYGNQWVRIAFDHPMPCGPEGWTSPHQVEVEYLGQAGNHLEPGVILTRLV